ncbi:MAG: hypothetical protein AAF152_03570 [Cyanobacteria bacterium P01_A01_bin.114]
MINLYISPKKTAHFLGWAAVGLMLCNIIGKTSRYVLGHGELLGFIDLFDVDQEFNLPALYSTLNLLACSILLSVIAISKSQLRDRYAAHWKGLALIFLCLAIDEWMSFHERLILPLRSTFGISSGPLYFTWVIAGFVFLSIFLIAYFKFILALPKNIRWLFLTAGAIYISGVLGLEIAGGWYASLPTEKEFTYHLFNACEEFLEMAGIVVFIYALLRYTTQHVKNVSLIFKEPSSALE